MSNLVQGGIPSDISALQHWNTYRTQLLTDMSLGNYYRIRSSGFMTQFVYLQKIVNSIKINITYRNISSAVLKGEIILYAPDNKDAHIYFYLDPSTIFKTVVIDLEKLSITTAQVAVEIRNTSTGNLDFLEIVLDGTLEDLSDTKIDTDEFIQKCVLFGLDSDKPDLR